MLGRTLLIALFLSTAPSLSTVAFSQEALVLLEDPTPAELCPSCSSVIFLLKQGKQPVQLAESPQVELVSLGGDRKIAQGFSAEWIGEPKPRAIKIKVDEKELVRSGTYEVYLNLQPKSSADAPRLKVQIFRPAPKIAAIPKLILDRTYWFIGVAEDTHPELFLHEVSKKSNLSNLIIDKVGNASIGIRPIGGMLQLLNPPSDIKAGEHKKIEYSLAKDFDVGTATGTMKIESAELIDPLGTFDFEVHSHVHWLYIGLTIAFGLFCSYLLKVWLQNRLELDQARLDACKLVERVAAEEVLHADPVFAITYRPLLNQLNAALTSTNPTDINNAKAALDPVWRKALQDLTKRHQDQLDALDKLRDITNLDWPVPAAVSTAILEARTVVAEVGALIERDDLTQAESQRRQAVMNLGNAVLQAALDWQSTENQILNALRSNPNGISQAVSAALAKPAQDLAASLMKISANTLVGTPEQIQQALSDVRSEQLLVRQFVDFLKQTIQTELSTAQASINTANLPNWDSNRFAALPTEVNAFIAFLDSTVDSPDLGEMATHLNDVHLAWTDALQGQFSLSNNANVQINLDSHNYVEAVGTAVQEKRVGSVALGARAQAVPFIAPTFLGYTSGPAAPGYYVRTRFQTLFTASPTQPTSVTLEAELKKDKCVQSLTLGLLLIVAGYGLQLNTFVGTFTEFSTLFFWAFGLDLTVEALRGAAKKN
jgi:hypothetical protein